VVKLAVAILHRTVSASPGFDSRPMQRAAVAILFVVLEVCCGGAGGLAGWRGCGERGQTA
jgi:hypothetical protein